MIYVWQTDHHINEHVSKALHAGIPENIIKHTSWADNYIKSTNKHTAVGYGILRGTGDIFKHNEQYGVDYYMVDRGYINPGHFDGYYRISKNGLQAKYVENWLWDDRLKKLKFKREEWFNSKGRILVVPPSEYMEAYHGHKPGWWEKEITQVLDGKSFKVRHKSDTSPLEHDLQDASCVITFNSNVAVDAVIKGVPVVSGMHSIVGNWSRNTLQDVIDNKIQPETNERVDQLLRFISYNQFTLEEIKNGTAWRLLHA